MVDYKPAFLKPINKAEAGNLDKEEKFFLDMYYGQKCFVFCCHNVFTTNDVFNKDFIKFACNDNVMQLCSDIMKRYEDALLHDISLELSVEKIKEIIHNKEHAILERIKKNI